MRKKKTKSWSNYGDGIQVYDVVFEVDKLDFTKKTQGKDSDAYSKQHQKAVGLVVAYNTEVKGRVPLSLSKCRSIIQQQRHAEEPVVFYNEGKKVAENKQEIENG